MRLADDVFAQYGEHQVDDILKIALYQAQTLVVGVGQRAKQGFHPLYRAFYIGIAKITQELGILETVGTFRLTVKRPCERVEKAHFNLIVWETEDIKAFFVNVFFDCKIA